MTVVNPDHLDPQRSEFSNPEQLLHLALLRVGQSNGVEGQRRIADQRRPNLLIEEQIGGADALFETWQEVTLNEEPIDVLSHGVFSMRPPQAIELSNCPE